MAYFCNSLIIPGTLEAREYQIKILERAKRANTLCVLPTGLGKTAIAIMLAAERLEQFPESKVLVLAPTRPLVEQHRKSFCAAFDLPKRSIVVVTGRIPPSNRPAYYSAAKIICATPQTIENDIANHILKLTNFCLLVVDEVHRAVKRYAYPFVARAYMQQAANPRILGLTASPGGHESRIKEVCSNLFIEHVEIRTEHDQDVSKYVKQIELETIKVELPKQLKAAQENLRLALRARLERLKKLEISVKTKKDLIQAQAAAQARLKLERNPILYHQISCIAESLKLWHALELLETQSVSATLKYLRRLSGNSKADKRIQSDLRVQLVCRLLERAGEHPKLQKIVEVVKSELAKNPKASLIIFSHYRDTIEQIYKLLREICSPAILIGQARGLSQKEQIDIIKDYEAGYYNCLITSPVGEEGLHLASADIAIFYEPVPSEIRTIQRRGRVGRTKFGKVIVLIARGTRDEANFYIARRKERQMKGILRKLA